MINKSTIIRITRSTDNLKKIGHMYQKGLGFVCLSKFYNHEQFDGIIIGHPQHLYHLEFTHHHGHKVGKAPTKDNLLVFYIPDKKNWKKVCSNVFKAGFKAVKSYNPYWDINGKTYEDIDKYRIVLEKGRWSK